MLKLLSIHTSYGHIKALKDIDIEIAKGEIVCLIGSNGAGKTTTLLTISGILKPDSGDMIFEGESLKNMAPHNVVNKGICQVPEGRRIFPRLTVSENLEMGAYSIGKRQKTKGKQYNMEKVFNLFPVLKERTKQMGGTLSGGEQQMLAIGRALMANPKLLLLDEPSLGLAPIMVSKIFKTIKEINEEGVTILLVEQNAKAALRLSHRGYVLENGVIKLSGRGEDLLHNENVKKAYLGD
ncbi:MAG TPA: ABC transporter ATP-binding protein [Nitrospiraceae bacterium]|nr:MAG: ABC transporter ATP-binding protein [Nitrospirae bacterium GWA2_46_11]OGW24164.1 MAG: ABC transporter ATP-binding protein [Nitrospirae bacterium GWB2_47_37]HAK89139.1 ABC transporter ATP-binding protein [Nitrospiraceae bacterium]HCZ10827.1 ABC transporter ATP-binding protein [Nitrospiraceae bacterium]